MRRVLFLLVAWVTGITLPVCAQTNLWASYEVFGEKEGFQNYYGPGRITCDKEGLLWIAGDNGLYSFDGTWFTNYRHMAGNDSSLPLNVVTMNYQDKAGNYWVVVPNKGLYRFDRERRSFHRFTYPGMDRFNIHQYRIGDFMEDGPLLWIVLSGYGLACWNGRDSVMQNYKICPPGSCGSYMSASWVTCMIKDSTRHCFWVGSNDGLIQYEPGTGALQVYRPPVLTRDRRTSPAINKLLTDADGMIWCGSWGEGLMRFDPNTKTFTRYLWKSELSGMYNICSGIFPGDSNHLWVCSRDEGPLLFDKRNGSFRKVRPPNKSDERLDVVHCFQSDPNTLWVADQKKLYRFNLDTSRFAWYPIYTTHKEAEIGRGVYNFVQANHTLYTGTFYGGCFGSYDRTSNHFFPRLLTGLFGKNNLQHLSHDASGTIWIGLSGGVFMMDPVTGKVLTPKKVGNSEFYFQSSCFDIVHARDGSHWIGTTKGLIRYDARTDSCTVFDTTQPLKHRLPGVSVYDLFEDSKGRIWIGTIAQGMVCYLPETDSIVCMPLSIMPLKDRCLSFCEDPAGRILFILESYGLVILEHPFTKQQKITLCNTSNYLPTDYISQVYCDNKKRIWLNTANGLLLFDPVKKSYIPFRQGDGLVDNYIDSWPYQDSAGYMYIGFSDGFQVFHPDSILARPAEKLHIRLNSMTIDGHPSPQHPAYMNEITLPPEQANLVFSFAAVGASLSGHYSYAYMLDNFDKDWIYTGANATGQYNNLPPGKYRLRIKAAIGNNQWVSEYFGIRVIALPAWYQTIWFKIVIALLIAGILYGAFSYRLQQVRREAALKESYHKRINELEMRSLRAQMNPHFIFNSLSSINRYIVKSDHKTASNYLTKFSRLIRLILDNSASDYISLEKEMQTLQLYIDLEALRFDDAFTYTIHVDDNIDQFDTLIPSMILQPYVENAIWHGLLHKEEGKGKLVISISQLSPALIMARIEDNGVGRQKAKEMKSKEAVKKKSYGMQISHDRLELLNRVRQTSSSVTVEDLTDTQGSAIGTRVILHIPVQNNLE
jgi:ligand-binding sensor domain-containing protein/two-component sensor histidine kinase